LTGAAFGGATFTGANFSGAVIRDTQMIFLIGFTAEQLYSTASYQTGDLSGVILSGNDLSGWNFAGTHLTDANFQNATLTDADLSMADLRGAAISTQQIGSASSTKGMIQADGSLSDLRVGAGERVNVWDYDGDIPITVESEMIVDPAGTLRMVFSDYSWGSPITFQPGVNVTLDGSLELLFADGVEPADLIDATFDLFDWEGATVTGTFDQIVTAANVVWNTSNLYTSGTVTLVSTELLLGDVTLDGHPSTDLLATGSFQLQGDMNQDGTVSGLHVNPFVAAVIGSDTDNIPEPSTLLLGIIALVVFSGRRKA
jgi:uncharacterized protein YjbI with pentapeptide repeats